FTSSSCWRRRRNDTFGGGSGFSFSIKPNLLKPRQIEQQSAEIPKRSRHISEDSRRPRQPDRRWSDPPRHASGWQGISANRDGPEISPRHRYGDPTDRRARLREGTAVVSWHRVFAKLHNQAPQ